MVHPQSDPLAASGARTRDDSRHARRHAILDAAERLFDPARGGLPSMADVADAAGVAKGTLYLYFESREAMLVALHARQIEVFFQALIGALECGAPFGIEQMAALVRAHLTGHPRHMALAGVCMGIMSQETARVPELRSLSACTADWVTRAGTALERRHPLLAPGEGARLLIHGYALIVGLWHLLGAPRGGDDSIRRLLAPSAYADEAELALRRHWRQVTGADDPSLSGISR